MPSMDGNVVCPWGLMSSFSPSPLHPPPSFIYQEKSFASDPLITQRKSFASVLHSTCDISLSQLSKPSVKGNEVAITIPEEEYQASLQSCKSHLHGRLFLSKGDVPAKLEDLRKQLKDLWSLSGRWGMISLGKGYYEFIFLSIEDLNKVRSVPSWKVKPGFLCLFSWSPDFNPDNQKVSNVQCWIRITGLPQEYWRSKILFVIANSIGTPICLDTDASKSAEDRSYGHFARILVDIDLNSQLRSQILVGRKDYAFFVGVEYENLLDFCKFYQCIGHTLASCKKNSTASDVHDSENRSKAPKEKHIVVRTVPKYVTKNKSSAFDKGKGAATDSGLATKDPISHEQGNGGAVKTSAMNQTMVPNIEASFNPKLTTVHYNKKPWSETKKAWSKL